MSAQSKMILCIISVMLLLLSGCSAASQSSDAADDFARSLSAHNWSSHAAKGTAIWISIKDQEVRLITQNKLIKSYHCSTAKAGAGNLRDSGKTPTGWHRVAEKIADGLPEGAVLKDRLWTGQICPPGAQAQSDQISSRILWLEGLEDGVNRGGDVDSKNRYIYIHGTNRVDELGRPASGGCIRMDPGEVIDFYGRVDEGTRVLITED